MRIRTVIFLPTKSCCIVPHSHHTCKSRVVREVALNRSLGITWPLSSFWLIHRLCVGGLHYLPVAENAPKRPALIPRNQNVINLLTLFKANKRPSGFPYHNCYSKNSKGESQRSTLQQRPWGWNAKFSSSQGTSPWLSMNAISALKVLKQTRKSICLLWTKFN